MVRKVNRQDDCFEVERYAFLGHTGDSCETRVTVFLVKKRMIYYGIFECIRICQQVTIKHEAGKISKWEARVEERAYERP